MTDDQINAAIAKACGWADFEDCSCGTKITAWPPFYSGHKKHIPNYCADLNAIHEAEKVLSPQQQDEYWDHLKDLTGEGFDQLHTTARQRAEAFLRTIGKWEEIIK